MLLSDFNGNREISDDLPGGKAFHEHAGYGAHIENNRLILTKIHNAQYAFWFDDNWLARYVAIAYDKPHPIGLHDHCATVRFRQLAGDNRCWTPYPTNNYINQRALNGIYKINAGDFAGALAEWTYIKGRSQWQYVSANQRYEYDWNLQPCTPVPTDGCFPNPQEEPVYYYALWLILSERLLAARAVFPERNDVLQHAISIRSNLLSWQIRDVQNGRHGCRTDVHDPSSLINTETQSLVVLALGAEASYVFEPGLAPMVLGPGNYFIRPHNALSAVVGLSAVGHMTYGPNMSLPIGTYDVDFSLRVPNNVGGPVATVDVLEGSTVLASRTLAASELPCCNQWARVRLSVTTGTTTPKFRVYWHGGQNLDIGSVRVIRR